MTEKSKEELMQEWRDYLEKAIKEQSPIEDLFEEQGLSQEEINILTRHKKYLLQLGYYENIEFKMYAHLLEAFESSMVTGPKENFLRKLFNEKHIQKVVKETHLGHKISHNSNQFSNILFELKLVYYFVQNKFNIELLKEKDKPIGEFIIKKNDIEFIVEAKNMDFNNVLDLHLTEERFIPSKHKGLSKEKKMELFTNSFQRNYNSAILKFNNNANKHIIIIQSHYLNGGIIDFVNNLPAIWKAKRNKNLVALIIIHTKTSIIENRISKISVSPLLNKPDYVKVLYPIYTRF